MDITNACNIIKKFENLKLEAYNDSGNPPKATIGYGTVYYPDGSRVQLGQSCTEQQANEWLELKVQKLYDDLQKENLVLNENQTNAILSLSYNIGEGSAKAHTGFDGSTMLQFLKDQKYTEAAGEFDKWIHDGGRVVQGLINRRAQEKALFLS